MIYQIPVDQITGLAKYGLALSCTAVSHLAESDLARYAPPVRGWQKQIVWECSVLGGIEPVNATGWEKRFFRYI